ncbi:hypothetical protein ACTXT7_016984 [Hymenolepis weldensis]
MIIDQFYDLIRVYKSNFDPDHDECMDEYVEDMFRVECDGEFDPLEVETFLKETFPSCSVIPSSIFTEWIKKTRLSLVNKDAPKKENEMEDKPSYCVDTLLELIPTFSEELRVTDPKDSKDNSKPKLTEEERQIYAQRYGFSRKGCSIPPAVTKKSSEPASKVRYLDGKVVSTSGGRYIEIKKEYPDMPPPVYLKSSRKYRFH